MKRNSVIVILFIGSLFILGCFQGSRKMVSGKNKQARQSAMSSFLFLSDVHLNADQDTSCMYEDAGKLLWAKCAQKLNSILGGPNPPEFIVYTGDLPVHYGCRNCKTSACPVANCGDTTVKQHNKSLRAMLKNLGDLAATWKVPVLYAPGNNDALKGNYYPFSGPGYSTPFSLINPGSPAEYPYTLFGVNKPSSYKLPYMVSDEGTSFGYWSVRVMDGLRMICLNTVIWGTSVENIVDSDRLHTMAIQEMNWLSAQLDAAAKNGDKVFLSMHIPPGLDVFANAPMWNSWDKYSLQDSFLQLVESYDTTITGIFYGHTHYDELRLLYNKAGNSVMKAAISCPGISTEHGNYPAFKVVQFDRKSKVPMDFTTYFTPLNCKHLTKVWGDSSYKFSSVFKPDAGMSIYQRLVSMDTTEVQYRMSLIYKAGNGTDSVGARGVVVKW